MAQSAAPRQPARLTKLALELGHRPSSLTDAVSRLVTEAAGDRELLAEVARRINRRLDTGADTLDGRTALCLVECAARELED